MPSLRALLPVLALLTQVRADIFTVTASLAGSPLDGQTIQASGSAFFLGLDKPSSYCPKGVVCPNTTETVFSTGLNYLWVETPGGQQVYLTSDGQLTYTQADSSSTPTGAFIGGYFNLTLVSDCAPTKTVLSFLDVDSSTEGFLACPDLPSWIGTTGSKATYQIYAKTPGFKLTDCIELDGLKASYKASGADFGAWEYA